MFYNSFIRYYTILFLCLSLSTELNCQTDFYKGYNASRQKYAEGKYDEALQINLKQLEMAEQSKIPSQVAYANRKVGNMHYFLHDREVAIKWYMLALAVIESENIDSMKPEIYHNISAMYNELHIFDSTLKYSQKAITIYKANKNYSELSRSTSALADIYLSKNRDLAKGERLIIEAEKYAKLANDDGMLAFACTKRAALYGRQNRFKEAAEQLKLPEEIYRKRNVADELMYLYRLGSIYYTKVGDPRGLSYIDSLLKWKDAIFKKESAKKVAEAEAIYHNEKKERENKLLQQENKVKELQLQSRNRTILVLIISILLIILIVLWRINAINLKKKEQALLEAQKLQKEKERISRDLHDNVGGQLSYVLYSIDSVNIEDKEKRSAVISGITESVRSVISNLRETIWAINDEAISANDFSDKLKVYVRSMFRNTETKIIFNENIENNIQLNSFVGLNLYRICQEIINNAFKHAEATELNIAITSDDKIKIMISDNGIGFDLNNTKEDGFGLANIKSRAAETNITLDIKTKPGTGTTYLLIV